MNEAFVRGFIKRAEFHGVNHEQAFFLAKRAGILDSIYQPTHDSLFSIADKLEPQIRDSHHKDFREMLEFGKHMGAHGFIPGALGAGAGAVAGHYGTKDESKRKRNSLIGAGIGGALGFGSGVYSDAKHLGENTKADYRTEYDNALDKQIKERDINNHKIWPFKHDNAQYDSQIDRYQNDLETIDNSSWTDMYQPDKMTDKLNR